MSSSVVTTRRQSSATGFQTEDCPSTSLPLTSTSILIGARVSTADLQELEANTESNISYPPRPINNQPSVNGRRRTRFTLHRLLSAVIPIVFVASKFIDGFHGKALTLGLLDLIPAILVFILYVFSWFESDPPPYLGWLFDTDWDYLLDITKRRVLLTKDLARRAKNNPSASLRIIFGVFSVLLAIISAILLSRNFSSDCTLAFISLTSTLMLVGGDQLGHQRNAYKHAFFMLAILTQLAMLASWTIPHWFLDRPRISMTLFYTWGCLCSIMNTLRCFTAHWEIPIQATTFFFVWPFVCTSISTGGTLSRLVNLINLNGGDPNFHHDLTITIGIWAFNVLAHGLSMYFYFWWWDSVCTRPLSQPSIYDVNPMGYSYSLPPPFASANLHGLAYNNNNDNSRLDITEPFYIP